MPTKKSKKLGKGTAKKPAKLGGAKKSSKSKKLGKGKVEVIEPLVKIPYLSLVDRPLYQLFILPREDEASLKELANTGRVIGNTTIDDGTQSIDKDEVVVVLRK